MPQLYQKCKQTNFLSITEKAAIRKCGKGIFSVLSFAQEAFFCTTLSLARAGRQAAQSPAFCSQPKLSQVWSGQGESTKRMRPFCTSKCTV